ncbi:hypothetical protein [Kitasatospora camelliae]|uniref:Immunity protein 35 of polymorphic toxin system n=1 Tax=Kitasatospora camelliae TaxID=3156397 RepID=A0AAU8K460_9ACTN
MRPARFESLLADAARHIPVVDGVKTLADAGHTEHPFGVVTHLTDGAQVWWSFTAMGRPGDSYREEEAPPVSGPHPEVAEVPAAPTGSIPMAYLEAALAAALLDVDHNSEIKGVTRFSEGEGSIPFGLTVDFHDGAKAFVNSLAAVRSGQSSPSGRWYEVPATV